MSAVWRHSQQKGSGLLLLLSLADYANDRGVAFPSVETLAQKVRMSPRNVQILLRKLEADGELIIEPNAGPRGANSYRLNLRGGENFSPPAAPKNTDRGENFSPPPTPKTTDGGETAFTGGVKRLSPGGETAFTGGVKQLSPDPSDQPSVEPSLEPSDDDDDAPAPTPMTQRTGKRQNSKRQDTTRRQRHHTRIPADAPSPPVAPAPPPAEVDAAEVAACAAALLEHAICATADQARHDAASLLADHPAAWIIRAAIQTAERPDVANPYAYMLKTIANWRSEGGPRPARKAGHQAPETEAERRAKYIPAEYADIILG